MRSKWLAAIPPYLAVWAGLFLFHSAWSALVGFHIGILLSLMWLKPSLPLNILWQPTGWCSVTTSILLCGSGGLGLYLLWGVLGISADLSLSIFELGLVDGMQPWFIAYFSLVNPFMEEYFWRGVLGSSSKSFYPGDLIYAGFHIFILWEKAHILSILLAISVLTFIGWFWRQSYRRDGSLLAPVLGHMAADFFILLVVFYIKT